MTQPSSVWAKVMGSQPLLGLQSIRRVWRRTAELWRGWRNHSSARLSAPFSRGPASRNVTFFPAAPNTWEVLRVRQRPPPGVLSCQDRLEHLEMVVGSCLGRVMPRSGGLGGLKVVPSSVSGFQVTRRDTDISVMKQYECPLCSAPAGLFSPLCRIWH